MTDAVLVLQPGPLSAYLDTRLAERHQVCDLEALKDAEVCARVRGILTSSRYPVTAALIARLPALQVISNYGVGYDAIDVRAAQARRIPVGYTPQVLTGCVADLAVGLLLDCVRGLSAADRFVRAGRWPQGPFMESTRVHGKRLGVVGFGRVGQEIVRRLQGFDLDVRYHDLAPTHPHHTFEPDLEALARWSDFLLVSIAASAQTRHLVDGRILRALGPGGFLVNVSRGSVVQQDDLIEALGQGHIAGAGLDVYQDEPQVPAALRALDNVVLLPHIASHTRETRRAMADLALDNLHSFFATGAVRAQAPSAAPSPEGR